MKNVIAIKNERVLILHFLFIYLFLFFGYLISCICYNNVTKFDHKSICEACVWWRRRKEGKIMIDEIKTRTKLFHIMKSLRCNSKYWHTLFLFVRNEYKLINAINFFLVREIRI